MIEKAAKQTSLPRNERSFLNEKNKSKNIYNNRGNPNVG